ncbi:MAG: hypothetical protein K9L84_05100 [Candidatus Omnitrophica bacterium]|nr:hypothetical protein [Candidatus Omnitrophota bacterium]MCF7894422.1 hypothetical protein [Candidatus Omnitrophota bacterium]
MKIKISLLLFMVLTISVWAQSEHKNPFESGLPQEESREVEEAGLFQDREEEIVNLPGEIVIEGVLWGSDKPQAIINGEVYSKGDSLKNNRSVSIFNIKNNIVFLSYQDKIFKKKPREKF